MFDISVTTILFVIFVFVLVKHAMDTQAKQARDKLRVLEEALKTGALDEEQKEQLMEQLTGRRTHSKPTPPPPRPVHHRHPNEVGVTMKLMVFLGWITFCLGMAFVIVVANSRGWSALELPATILPCVGFGLVTFPFVIRELQGNRRSPAQTQHQTQHQKVHRAEQP